TVTVVDYDGCVSTAQYIINGLSEEDEEGISIYPNPASTAIYIDLSESSNPIERLQLISINGQVLNAYRKTDQLIDISTLSEGVYILKIELAGGKQINKRVLILK
ncbi:MAG: T9SS type A sorting domain-containing protein, partial [Saprospiraceae bacterium]|nr:T9SS type A sorting domain-containing protein [Saprospiraceae bacterium]